MLLPQGPKLVTIVLISAVAGVDERDRRRRARCSHFLHSSGSGIPAIVANATSTVALWPGAVSSMFGYREELAGARRWAIGFALPSLLGGGLGAWLLLRTPPARFAALVPWLVLGATALFIVQPPVMRRVRERRDPPTARSTSDRATKR